ncbi:MAG TPA: MBL fold metallo-hydrolase [Feifaniaceae bacterium]|nr:MBL fold metallo-hydrolase [Feifaniaceae bacterium]
MYLTVLGRYGPYPRSGGACSGYLLEDGETRVLIDCGAGVFARLIEFVSPEELSAVVLSHLHYDHCSDLFVMRYALDNQLPGADGEKRRMPLYAPEEPFEVISALTKNALFERHTVKGEDELQIGSLTFRFTPMAHPVPTNGMRITGSNGHSLFFTGDTKPFSGMSEAARGATALLADTCFVNDSQQGPHLNAKEACAMAREAGVQTLYCTHLWGKEDTEEALKKEIDFPSAFVVQERGRYRI